MNKQKLLFVIIGIANTAIDFVVLNIFTAGIGFPRVWANIISVTVAIIFSYFANNQLVFESNKKTKSQATMFFVVTLFSLYIIQTLVILLLTEVWRLPIDSMISIKDSIGLNVSNGFVETNGSKIVATLFSMTFNFIMYDRFVFKDQNAG